MPLVRIKFEPRDLWVGVYWTNSYYECFREAVERHGNTWSIYVCIVPMFPIVVIWSRPGSQPCRK